MSSSITEAVTRASSTIVEDYLFDEVAKIHPKQILSVSLASSSKASIIKVENSTVETSTSNQAAKASDASVVRDIERQPSTEVWNAPGRYVVVVGCCCRNSQQELAQIIPLYRCYAGK